MKTLYSFLLLLIVSTFAPAQQPAPTPVPAKTAGHCHICVRRVVKIQPARPMPALSPAADFFVGEARVDVTKDETVVRLAMAQHGSVLIELPANDGPRYIIPGDPKMATVDEKALERNKRAIVVRPGSLFVSPLPNRRAHSPAATVTAQMRSGLVVTFLFYPVEDLAQNVHRCVLNYQRDEVVARRRAAGLPVNLDNKEQGGEKTTAQSTAPISISVDDAQEGKSEKAIVPVATPTPSPASEPPPASPSGPRDQTVSPKLSVSLERNPDTTDSAIETAAHNALQEALKHTEGFRYWTKPTHGLSLSTIQPGDIVGKFRIAIVAISNTTREPLKLTSESPDLSLEMVDEHGKPLTVQSIKKLHTEVSDPSGVIPAETKVYYAIVFASPILGTHHQLKIAVSQTNAVDEPASLMLANVAR
jgi:hypothetical protein